MRASRFVAIDLPRLAGTTVALLLLLSPLCLVLVAGWPGSVPPEVVQMPIVPSRATEPPLPEPGLEPNHMRGLQRASWLGLLGGVLLVGLLRVGRCATPGQRSVGAAAAGALSLILYLYAFLLPYPLPRY
ncbi:MAG: hypothetical protein ACP5SI_11340, partial [Chloroflexia bacterium]